MLVIPPPLRLSLSRNVFTLIILQEEDDSLEEHAHSVALGEVRVHVLLLLVQREGKE